jgi:hypothetical protein
VTLVTRFPTPVPSGGDVDGPASSTNNAVALFDGTTGKLLKNSLITVNSSGKLFTVASAAGGAGINIAPGSAPTSPIDGDLWTTSAGVFARINGVTQGPFESAAGTYQPASGDLTAIDALAGTSGLLKKTATDTWALDTTAYAPLASPTFTGTPAAPTAAVDTNTTQLATTAYVVGQGYLKSATASSTYQPLDGDLTSIAGLAGTSGLLRKTAANTWSLDTASYLTANQTITLSGDATGSGTTAITVTVADDSHAHTSSTISALDAADTTTGIFDIARIPTGSTGTTVALGNHTHSYLSSSTSSTQAGYFGDIYLYDDSTPSHYLQITNSANLTLARILNINVNDADRTISLSGNLTVSSAATISGTNTGDQTITLTGDATGSGTGSFATTLATVNSNVGSYGSASSVATFTVNAKGLTTAAGSTAIQIAQSQVNSLVTDLSNKQPLDADLTAIAALAGTSGFLKKTAADTWSLDTSTYLTGNQTITLSGDAVGSGTTAITVAVVDDSHNHTGTTISALDAGDVATGTFAIGRIPTGTTSTTVSLGDHTHSYLALSGGTLTGKLTTVTSGTGAASLSVPHGTAPTSPANGDMWTTTSGLYVRVNGATVGPLAAASGAATWGSITGTLSSQTDLSNALNAKISAIASTDHAIVRFDGVAGAVQDSPAYLDDDGSIIASWFHAYNGGGGQNYKVGDDAWIGDINIASTIRVMGTSVPANGYIVFGNSNSTALGRAGTGALTYGGNTVWHAGNDGAGTGLDADLLDGNHASYFAPLSSPALTGTPTISGNTIWHAGNDGSTSGLDADLLDGNEGSYYAPNNNPTFTGTVTLPASTTLTTPLLNGVVNIDAGTSDNPLRLKVTDSGWNYMEFYGGASGAFRRAVFGLNGDQSKLYLAGENGTNTLQIGTATALDSTLSMSAPGTLSNNSIKIGTGSYATDGTLHAVDDGNIILYLGSSGVYIPRIRALRPGGTFASKTATAASTNLFEIDGLGYGTSAFVTAAGIRLMTGSGTISNTSMPGRISFYTVSDGSTAFTERMRIDQTGSTTFYGSIIAPAATTSISSIRIPHGTAPSSPTNGDIWTTTTAFMARMNGASVNLLGTQGSTYVTIDDEQVMRIMGV